MITQSIIRTKLADGEVNAKIEELKGGAARIALYRRVLEVNCSNQGYWFERRKFGSDTGKVKGA